MLQNALDILGKFWHERTPGITNKDHERIILRAYIICILRAHACQNHFHPAIIASNKARQMILEPEFGHCDS